MRRIEAEKRAILESDVDDKIPKICPSVCDPFKNRANKLLEIAYEIYKEDGLNFLIKNSNNRKSFFIFAM